MDPKDDGLGPKVHILHSDMARVTVRVNDLGTIPIVVKRILGDASLALPPDAIRIGTLLQFSKEVCSNEGVKPFSFLTPLQRRHIEVAFSSNHSTLHWNFSLASGLALLHVNNSLLTF